MFMPEIKPETVGYCFKRAWKRKSICVFLAAIFLAISRVASRLYSKFRYRWVIKFDKIITPKFTNDTDEITYVPDLRDILGSGISLGVLCEGDTVCHS